MTTWPPTLQDLKDDMGETTGRDDSRLQRMLDAAVAFVQRRHAGVFDFAGDELSGLPPPDEDLVTGTIRLARRWHTRGRSPDGLIDAGDLGTNRVPSLDHDIARMLRIGPYSPAVFA